MKVGLTCVLAVALVAFPADIKGDWPFSPSWPFQHSRFPNTWAPSGAWASTWKNMMNPMSDSAESMEHDPEAEMLPEAIGGTLGGAGGPGWVDFAPSIFRPKFPTSFADLFGNGGFGRPNRRIPWWKG
ncbi:hypothetical protein J437_LFUL001087 [Ladona fulva]|uniref:Uncharacterized protein n=1 Tax=Ladona fulva TaxID=123851 RepID=A0A8K0JY87_LADFU|nr:hypothetical protein J437_LFUL001087 [Ladona fulva]